MIRAERLVADRHCALKKRPRPLKITLILRSAMDGHLCRCGTYPRVLQGHRLESSDAGSDSRAALR
jgi:aerobic-type carbon monoxide dehydrogenase small subunit (CoxS/CutS family)